MESMFIHSFWLAGEHCITYSIMSLLKTCAGIVHIHIIICRSTATNSLLLREVNMQSKYLLLRERQVRGEGIGVRQLM